MVVETKRMKKQRATLMEESAKLKETSKVAFKINELVKLCSNCNTIKVISDFGKRSSSRDGYSNQCKECLKAKRLERAGAVAVTTVATAAIAEVTTKVNEAAEGLHETTQNVLGKVHEGTEDVLGTVAAATDAAVLVAGTVGETVETVEEAVEEIKESVEEVKEALAPAVGFFERYFSWIKKMF